MLNVGYKKAAIARLDNAKIKHQNTYESTMKSIGNLHDKRTEAVTIICQVEDFINNLTNTPKEFQKILSEVKVNRKKFENEVTNLKEKSRLLDKLSGGIAGAGMVAGAGIAAFGPTAALAIATTFGTASTGTAIATLSGAAATNAALAWIGGGALAAGGGGIVAGQIFLTLAGPVGWTIGGAAILGGSALANSKNKQLAETAEKQTKTVNTENTKLLKIEVKVTTVLNQIIKMSEQLNTFLSQIKKDDMNNYLELNDEQLEQLKILLNVTMSLSNKLHEKVS